MSQPLPQSRFVLAVHEGRQVTVQDITRVELLLSIVDPSRRWIGWYAFREHCAGAEGPAGRVGAAAETIRFGHGIIERAALQLRRPRTVDGFATGGPAGERTVRIHEARFEPLDKAGDRSLCRLELALGFDFVDGRERESVRATVAVLSRERPRGAIHPALGRLVLLRREALSSARPAATARVA